MRSNSWNELICPLVIIPVRRPCIYVLYNCSSTQIKWEIHKLEGSVLIVFFVLKRYDHAAHISQYHQLSVW